MSPVLIISIIAIGFILAIIGLIVALKSSSKKKNKSIKKKTNKKTEIKNKEFDFDDLMEIVKNPKTPSNALLDALIYFDKNFKMEKNNNSKKYLIFLSRALTHPNRNKDIFKYFHNKIKSKNYHLKSELESIEKKALN